MRLLHTSDWHVGKRLRGESRLDEHRRVLAEVVDVARARSVDLVLVTGDLFETSAPRPDAQRVVWDTLLALRDTGAKVVVVAGNHDDPHSFDAVRPLFAALDVALLGHPAAPDQGGVLTHETAAGERAIVALLPFVSQRYVVRTEELLELDAAASAGHYAERVARIVDALCRDFGTDTVNLLAAHAFVRGGVLGGGERDAQTIESYGLSATAFPETAHYVALGHLHRTQQIPGPAPIWYAGSPVQVDFGEEADAKQVLVVDAVAGTPARVEAVPLASAASLRTLRGTLDELRAVADDVGEAWLRVFVREPARVGLADEVREILPRAVDVRVEHATDEPRGDGRPRRRGRTAHELFTEFLAHEGIDDHRLLTLFARLYDDETRDVGV